MAHQYDKGGTELYCRILKLKKKDFTDKITIYVQLTRSQACN